MKYAHCALHVNCSKYIFPVWWKVSNMHIVACKSSPKNYVHCVFCNPCSFSVHTVAMMVSRLSDEYLQIRFAGRGIPCVFVIKKWVKSCCNVVVILTYDGQMHEMAELWFRANLTFILSSIARPHWPGCERRRRTEYKNRN